MDLMAPSPGPRATARREKLFLLLHKISEGAGQAFLLNQALLCAPAAGGQPDAHHIAQAG